MNIVNSALTEVRTATRDLNDQMDAKRQEIAKMQKRLEILASLRVSMEDAVDGLAAVDAATNQQFDLDLDDQVIELDARVIELDADDVNMDDTAAL